MLNPSNFFIPLLLVTGLCKASATSNEFEPCHQRAVLILGACLAEQQPGSYAPCWQDGRKQHQACITAVIQSHSPVLQKQRAERAREAQLALDGEQAQPEKQQQAATVDEKPPPP